MIEYQREISGSAPAKVNAYLAVHAKRCDDFHEVESLIVPVDLCDTLTLCVGVNRPVEVCCPAVPSLETNDNLAVRAARWYLARLPSRFNGLGAHITIEKRIPLAAGLGGGSADAAAVLRLLEQVLGYPLGRAEIGRCAGEIGADVPACFDGKCRWVSGIGDVLGERVELPRMWLVLVNPGFEVSTRWVYENLASTRLTKHPIGGRKLTRFSGVSDVAAFMRNDLESVTFQAFPDLSQVRKALHEQDALGVLMAGSGPTVFGLFERLENAVEARKHLTAAFPKWGVWVASNII